MAGVQIWSKPLGEGKAAVLFINGGSTNTSATITLEELNITATGRVTATDVWTGADAGAVSNGHWSTGVVGTLDSAFVIIGRDQVN